MTLQEYRTVLRERWKTVVAAIVLSLAIASAVFFLRPVEYTANVSLYVSAQVGEDPQQAYQGAQLSEQRVKSYTELVTGDRVIGETIRRLGLNVSPAELKDRIQATTTLDSVIINVAVTEKSPQQAAAMADTVGSVLTDVVAELERPASPAGTPPVAVRQVQAASIPSAPSSAGLPVILGAGLVIGLGVGVALAVIRSVLDTSVKSAETLTDASGAPFLGQIALDPKVAGRPLTIHEDRQSSRAEAFRQLRTSLQFLDVDQPRQVLLVTSSVSMEGKTTTVANLAIALASAQQRVLVVEADLRRPQLSNIMGIDRSVGVSTVLAGRTVLLRAIQSYPAGGFDVLASGRTPPNPSELLASRQMRSLLDEARREYDFILVDSPPLLPVTDAAALAPATDGVILVCRFGSTTRSQLATAASAIRSVSSQTLGAILTMAPPTASGNYDSYYSSEVASAEDHDDLSIRAPEAGPRVKRTNRVDSDDSTMRLQASQRRSRSRRESASGDSRRDEGTNGRP